MLIANASHNLIVASLSQLLYSKMFNTIFAALSGGMLEQPGCMEVVDRHHSELHMALMQRDGVNAKRIAQAHARHTAHMLRQQIQPQAG
jgi:DNA-binding FadR family transcriptional regulator